jgi:hypothetical protein
MPCAHKYKNALVVAYNIIYPWTSTSTSSTSSTSSTTTVPVVVRRLPSDRPAQPRLGDFAGEMKETLRVLTSECVTGKADYEKYPSQAQTTSRSHVFFFKKKRKKKKNPNTSKLVVQIRFFEKTKTKKKPTVAN